MTKRLTEKQKEEIVKSFKYGIAIGVLSQKYNCTNSTIIRNLKKNLGELKYKEYFNKRKSTIEKSITNKNQTNDLNNKDFDSDDLRKDSNKPKVLNGNITASNFAPMDAFFEIGIRVMPIRINPEEDANKQYLKNLDSFLKSIKLQIQSLNKIKNHRYGSNLYSLSLNLKK